jgi:hypothetical protein
MTEVINKHLTINNNVTSKLALYVRKSLTPTDVKSSRTRQGIFKTLTSQIIYRSGSQPFQALEPSKNSVTSTC